MDSVILQMGLYLLISALFTFTFIWELAVLVLNHRYYLSDNGRIERVL